MSPVSPVRRAEIAGPAGALHCGTGLPLLIICGPCVIESREHALRHAEAIKGICAALGLPFVFKSSYDKANRTSGSSFRGLGAEAGLKILGEIQAALGVPVLTDVHSPEEALAAAEYVDVLQIPAFLCRQTDLLAAAGSTGKAVNIKKGQFLAPEDMKFAADKVRAAGSNDVLLCERGTCFGYRDLIVDMRGLITMSQLGSPVVFDATHSVQSMGGAGGASSGNRANVPPLARAAVAVGVDAVFIEAHEAPDSAPSDGANMVPLPQLSQLLSDLKKIHELRLETRASNPSVLPAGA